MARVACLIEALQKERRASGEEGKRMVMWGWDGSESELTCANEGSAVRKSTPLMVEA